jgi:hypothetical protein
VKKLQDVFQKAMEHPDHVKRVEKAGLAVKVMVGDDYAKYYRDLHAKAAKYTELARSRAGQRSEPGQALKVRTRPMRTDQLRRNGSLRWRSAPGPSLAGSTF